MGYLHSFKVTPHKKTVIYKEEKTILEKPKSRDPLSHVIKGNVFSTGTN